jgi:YidC/Oxa1 family membrane protein insertase
MSILNPLYRAVSAIIVAIHAMLTPIFGADSGVTWALSIVLLTVAMRIVLIPVFVKQVRSQRAMQVLQPKMKELQEKYKNDKERLNQEMMALWKEHGANPFSGCLPLLLQLPIFFALFHTLRELKPNVAGCNDAANSACYHAVNGFSATLIASAAQAKIFGVPISATFRSSASYLEQLGSSQTATRTLCLVMTLLMAATTFISQRQIMARSGPAANAQMAQTQKIMLYIFPAFMLLYGFEFPVGVLLYWLTTNFWSMGQQRIILRRMDLQTAAAGPGAPPPAGPPPGAKPKPPPPAQAKPAKPVGQPRPAPAGGDIALPPGGAIPPGTPGPGTTRRPPSRSKKRKRGRR